MKRPSLLVALVALAASGEAVHAQDAASLRAAIESHYAQIHAGNLDAVFGQHLDDFSWFSSDGRLLMDAEAAASAQSMGTELDFGTINVYMSHFNAQIHGAVGVATFYLVGSFDRAGESRQGTWRVSAVWVWGDGEWKEAHHHESRLEGELHP